MTTALAVSRATEADREVLLQLWTMFRHDMSEFTGALPDARGRFRQERLDAGLSDPAWAAYLFRVADAPVGLGVARALDADEAVISSFFLVHAARRAGHGRAAVRAMTADRPGRWTVAFQDENHAAARFWRVVAADADPDWTLERRSVPGRPELPPDTWIHFQVG